MKTLIGPNPPMIERRVLQQVQQFRWSLGSKALHSSTLLPTPPHPTPDRGVSCACARGVFSLCADVHLWDTGAAGNWEREMLCSID